MLALAVPAALLVGLALGALGGGGSILTVPALVYLLGQSPHAATTGSLLIVGITALAGTAAHWRAGRVRVGSGAAFGVLGVAGSYLGSRLSAQADPHLLLAAFSALMLVAAAAMLRRARRSREVAPAVGAPADPYPSAPAGTATTRRAAGGAVGVLDRPRTAVAPCPLPSATGRMSTCRALKVVAAATVVGLLTGFFGVGGGFVIVPALVLALDFPMPVAVGTSLLVIAVNSVAALGARLGSHAHLDWTLLGVFTAVAILGSVAGNRVASKVDARKLTVAFSALLVGLAAYTAIRSLPHLV